MTALIATAEGASLLLSAPSAQSSIVGGRVPLQAANPREDLPSASRSAALVDRVPSPSASTRCAAHPSKLGAELASGEFGETEAAGVAIRPTSVFLEPVTSAPAERRLRLVEGSS